ncbi:MAG: hypothetical protein R3182_05715 [Draconibacterium sp.]|nr:hypothetical protein [Draconibacterium sp.]
MKRIFHLFLLVFIAIGFLITSCAPKWEINNPYENVDWENHKKYKANLHTHTTRSDGGHSPQDIVDRYNAFGYKILAITDHNEVTFPWVGFSELSPSEGAYKKLEEGRIDSNAVVYEDRNPKELGMFAIQANEVSSPHHLGSFFSDYLDQPGDEHTTIEEIGKKNGIILLHHPGRYTSRDPEKYTVDWYVDLFTKFDYVTGMEVYNQGDRYKNDRVLWDSILVRTMTERPVWGYSNDDYHGGITALGRNWNLFILPELTEESIRLGMMEGRFLYTYAFKGHNGPEVPQIESINVDNKKGIIEIVSSGQDSIRWISGGDVVCRGNKINLSELTDLSNYVRAEIFGPESITGTQPFGIKQE